MTEPRFKGAVNLNQGKRLQFNGTRLVRTLVVSAHSLHCRDARRKVVRREAGTLANDQRFRLLIAARIPYATK